MTYARMVYSDTNENDQFFTDQTINGVNSVYHSSAANNTPTNNGGNNSLLNNNFAYSNNGNKQVNHNNKAMKASLSNNGITNAMEMIQNKISQQQQQQQQPPQPIAINSEAVSATSSSGTIPSHQLDAVNYIHTAASTNTPTILHLQQPLQHILEQQKQKEDEANEENEESDDSFSDSDSDSDDDDDDSSSDDEEEEPSGPTKRVRRVEDITPVDPVLKQPIYIVQHNIPFFVKGMNNHLMDKDIQPFQLDCFGSGFVFEPLENNEVKLTYVLQLTKSDWMEDEAEVLLDDLARSRSRSISTLISHAYHLSRA
ncbi:cyclin-like F-box containing protein [Heterostelium album PN500]|uniref:Cyclin-like F-box containing protein n=1 Tax=Heterostelium pallidum (strain ATCC 26659 / Pp 5 / PN500) TaxID=670386 RepID=D3BUA9_HETP5|nr:cyclin-like F-box containing protein [Heterostelium album PN500]EFA75043.1 cyclin-like F-box containing protein [Heterostelium album PN500]|eukprot:XP_020427177.1 cyclin-like F-box containing protein [Heterostelium album PN500]